jgi:hypothetical protein
MFDFNIAPGVCAIGQEQPMLPCGNPGTAIIGEVHIPQNSNTPAVCRKLIQMYGKHKGDVYCYGDASGGNDGSAKIQGSDWDLIRTTLRPVFGDRLRFNVPAGNPAERSRVNTLNARLKSGPHEHPIVRMQIRPECKNVIRDFDGVRTLEGGSGEIDKKADPELSHISDAIGYYTHRKFPILKRVDQGEF